MFLCDPQLGESEQQSGGDTQPQSAERPEASPGVSQSLRSGEETTRDHSGQQQAWPARRRQKVCECVRDASVQSSFTPSLCPNVELNSAGLCSRVGLYVRPSVNPFDQQVAPGACFSSLHPSPESSCTGRHNW